MASEGLHALSAAAADGRGWIHWYAGPVRSGKSSAMLAAVRRLCHQRPGLVVTFAGGERYGEAGHGGLETHSREIYRGGAAVEVAAAGRLADVPGGALARAAVVGIDEGQFFPDLLEGARRWAAAGKVVIVAGLDRDYAGRPFPAMDGLYCAVDSAARLLADCDACGKNACASFNRRAPAAGAGGGPGAVDIGGTLEFQPVCRACFSGAPPGGSR